MVKKIGMWLVGGGILVIVYWVYLGSGGFLASDKLKSNFKIMESLPQDPLHPTADSLENMDSQLDKELGSQ